MDDYLTKLSIEYSATEPSFARLPYAGWIPTVNGRLSFRHIGETTHPSKSFYANASPSSRSRYILAYQIRPLSDALFKPFIHSLLRFRGDIPFIIAAKVHGTVENDFTISGNIYIFRSMDSWTHSCASRTSEIIHNINDRRLAARFTGSTEIRDYWQQSRDLLKSHADVTLYFRLLRTGEVYFSDPAFRSETLRKNTIEFALAEGHDFLSWISNQAYFFLRDICHKHQHHDAHSDTILVLQRRSPEHPLEWRKNIIFSLQYYIIRSKRFADGPSLAQSLGILAYCTSFEEISSRAGIRKGWKNPDYNNTALRQSLEARIKEVELRGSERDGRFTRTSVMVGTYLAVLGLLTAFVVMMVQPSIENGQAPRLAEFSLSVARHFSQITLTIVAFTLLVGLLFLPPPSNRRTGFLGIRRDLLELLNVRRVLFIRLTGIAGVVIAALSFYVGRDLIFAMTSFLARLIDLLR